MSGLSHVDDQGRARMVDVSDKEATVRTATAHGVVTCKPQTLDAVRAGTIAKGAVIQADGEGFTNEEGFHIVWQFSDSVSGPWNMGVLQDGTWHHFKMDLGDPGHREAFLNGEMPDGLTAIQLSSP